MRVGVIMRPKKAAQQQVAKRLRLRQVIQVQRLQLPHRRPRLRNFAQA